MANVILEERWAGNFYARLDSNVVYAAERPWATVDNIIITEKVNWMSPIVEIRAVDSLGVITSAGFFSPSATYKLHFGTDPENTVVIPLTPIKLNNSQMQPGRVENFHVDMMFYMDHWNKMIQENFCRGWKDRKYSDVVNMIAEECGFDEIDIEPTRKKYNVIQPDMSNYHFLHWLRSQSRSEKGSPSYQFGIRTDSSFYFQSLNRLQGNRSRKTIIASAKDFDVSDDNIYMAYNIDFQYNYFKNVIKGAGGVKEFHYDWNNKEFVTEDHFFSDSNQSQLSEWSSLGSDHEVVTKVMNGSRDVDTANEAKNKVSNRVNDIYSVNVTVLGTQDFVQGEVVKFIINTSENWDIDISESNSGWYLVTGISHKILSKKKQFITDLTLERVGNNSTEASGLVESTIGKI